MKKALFIIFFIATIVWANSIIFAQDIHFSQVYSTPMLINPANTGHYAGNLRIINNYRTQWRLIDIPYNTINVSVDKNIQFSKDILGIGVYLVNDQSGSNKLTTNKIVLSAAIQTFIEQNHLLFGLQFGFIYKKFDLNGITFPEQYNSNSGEFDPSYSTDEPGFRDWNSYFDLNTGIIWRRKIQRYLPEIGLSVYHLNLPKESFIKDGKWPGLLPRYHFYSNTLIEISEKLDLRPGIFYMKIGKSQELLIGSNIILKPDLEIVKFSGIYLGSYYRSNLIYNFDALILNGGIGIFDFNIGIDYDLNLSSLHKASNFFGAFEFSVIYILNNKRIDLQPTPCLIL